MTDKYITIYEKFLSHWGLEPQMNIAIEEMSELTKELCKFYRFKNNETKLEEIKENIKEEIADVLNVVEQLENYFGVDEIEEIRQQKINRTIDRINKGGTK